VLLVDPAENNAFRALNRAWQQGASVQASGGASGAPIRYSIRGLSPGAQDELVTSFALRAERVVAAPGRAVRRPRIGLYQPWTGSMDEGWTRWVLEQYGFTCVLIHPEDLKSPLGEKVDVLIVADDARFPIAASAGGAAGQGGRGGRGGGRAGEPREIRPEYAYQLTAADLQSFEQFIRGGGTLVCLGNAGTFAMQQFKLPVRNVIAGLRPEEFFLRGSIVEVTTDPSHPVMAGMPEKAAVFVDGSPVFEPQDGFTGTVLARYQPSGSPLLSGYLIGESHLHDKAAALDVPLGEGHVVLLGFRPEWRGQPFGTFRVLFNAALFSR
jgi:ribosomal protein S18 acetylase RimI-like enzyme